jgi:hypothetical protein
MASEKLAIGRLSAERPAAVDPGSRQGYQKRPEFSAALMVQ